MAQNKVDNLVNSLRNAGLDARLTNDCIFENNHRSFAFKSIDIINDELDNDTLDHTTLLVDNNGKITNICYFGACDDGEVDIESKAELDRIIRNLQIYRDYFAK